MGTCCQGASCQGKIDVVSKKNIGRCYCAEWLPLLPLTSVTQVHIPVGDKIWFWSEKRPGAANFLKNWSEFNNKADENIVDVFWATTNQGQLAKIAFKGQSLINLLPHHGEKKWQKRDWGYFFAGWSLNSTNCLIGKTLLHFFQSYFFIFILFLFLLSSISS